MLQSDPWQFAAVTPATAAFIEVQAGHFQKNTA
jgi:hypothetical protein